MDLNPLFDFEPSVHDASSYSSLVTCATDGAATQPASPPPPPPRSAPTSTLQTVNIKSHVTVTLDLANPNYPEWRCFFDSVIGKFGLRPHSSP